MHAASLGADSIGLVFHPPSPRSIDIDQAIAIRRALPPFVTVTALLLNESEDWIAQVIHQVKPDCLQFHGEETAGFCESWNLPYIKSIAMASTANPVDYAGSYTGAQGFLLDSNAAGRRGGSGDTFDWSEIPSPFDYPLILAGGLDSSNVAEAIARVRPWGVDVSSGVEISKGVKSTELIDQFFQEVKRGDADV
jgi:phosphoribosylanthranilate isomerase